MVARLVGNGAAWSGATLQAIKAPANAHAKAVLWICMLSSVSRFELGEQPQPGCRVPMTALPCLACRPRSTADIRWMRSTRQFDRTGGPVIVAANLAKCGYPLHARSIDETLSCQRADCCR